MNTHLPPLNPTQATIDFALELAKQSGVLINRYFAEGVAVETKPDLSPVTEADKQAEALMRRLIEKTFPEHCILGEEEGESGPKDSPWCWVLDPIDGTRSFVYGVPLFGTLISLQYQGISMLGIIHLSALKQLLLGVRGKQAWLNGQPVRVRAQKNLHKGLVLYTDWAGLCQHRLDQPLLQLAKQGTLLRGWGDCYGHFLVACGKADAMIDAQLKRWDVASLIPCVEAAGGRVTDIEGRQNPNASAISTNGSVHRALLQALSP